MWIVSEIGFFNIIQYPEDVAKGTITVKARRRQDLLSLQAFTGPAEIEESKKADYRYRMKIPRNVAVDAIAILVNRIEYSRTKDRLRDTHPDRYDIYFSVWNDLTGLDPRE